MFYDIEIDENMKFPENRICTNNDVASFLIPIKVLVYYHVSITVTTEDGKRQQRVL